MTEVPSSRGARRVAIIVAAVIFLAIIVVSLGLALSTPIVLPPATTSATGPQAPAPYVLVEVIEQGSTTYTTTVTTTPQLTSYPVVLVGVLVVVNGTVTYTTTTTYTSTITTWT